MQTHFLPSLSQNYLELLEDNEYYDIIIKVGEDPNVKIFRAHMNILCYRSPYLRQKLSSYKKNNENISAHISLPDISPKIFQIILKYIYGGILSLSEQETESPETLEVLFAADELLINELADYLQNYLLENKLEWMEQHFELIHRKSFQSNNLLELQQFCTNLMAKTPEKIFNSPNFTSLPEKSLVQLIKRDDLQMKEIEIWENVLKWGLAQNPTLVPNPDSWTSDDFETMENTLQHCLPLIRFFSLSSKEFLQQVHPYKKLLKHQLYKDLLNSHLDPDSEPAENMLLPRNIKVDGIIDSNIVNLSIISTISRRIDNVDSKFAHLREFYLPYKFELLLRGSRSGFTPKVFHSLCDYQFNTVTFIKVKGTEEILGGYNPLEWKSSGWGKTKDSFVFSFKSKINFFKDAIISNVENASCAVYYHTDCGPYFGNDIMMIASSADTDYDVINCKKSYYEKEIRNTEDYFSIDDYEVYQIIRK